MADNDKFHYIVCGKEVGDSGTPHLQIHIVLKRGKSLVNLKRYVGIDALHCDVQLGTDVQASTYCKKDGDFYEVGNIRAPGTRSDLVRFKDWLEDHNGGVVTDLMILKSEFFPLWVKYGRLTEACRILSEPQIFDTPLDDVMLRSWQTDLDEVLGGSPDDRTVHFIVDPSGGMGKSYFQRFYFTANRHKTQLLTIGDKGDNLRHMVDESKSVFFFNAPRGYMQYCSYAIFEGIKDRGLSSGKYQSRMKHFTHNSFIVVFCNEPPKVGDTEGGMTADRYDITYIHPDL